MFDGIFSKDTVKHFFLVAPSWFFFLQPSRVTQFQGELNQRGRQIHMG